MEEGLSVNLTQLDSAGRSLVYHGDTVLSEHKLVYSRVEEHMAGLPPMSRHSAEALASNDNKLIEPFGNSEDSNNHDPSALAIPNNPYPRPRGAPPADAQHLGWAYGPEIIKVEQCEDGSELVTFNVSQWIDHQQARDHDHYRVVQYTLRIE